ncbi:hypothetical protein KJ909_03695 [Patescibacteria group bacterium]|nr:hypothetical protein [Patescibacteria group bacterium]
MTDQEIFDYLFKRAKTSKDQEGVVAACLVKNGQILVSSPSADDSIRHAEDLVIEKAKKQGIILDENIILYTTLEPCSVRNKDISGCVSIIVTTGIKNIIYATNDPEYSQDTKQRFLTAGVNYQQIQNKEIIDRAVKLFNSTSKTPLTAWQLPRQKKLEIFKLRPLPEIKKGLNATGKYNQKFINSVIKGLKESKAYNRH